MPSLAEPWWPDPPQLAVPARVAPGQRGFKSSFECGPSQADSHACSLDTKMAWSEQETLNLIELWGEDSIQVQIRLLYRKRKVSACNLLHIHSSASVSTNSIASVRNKKHAYYSGWLALLAQGGSARLGSARLCPVCNCARVNGVLRILMTAPGR